ncbi:MAG: MFS transporter [Acidobacteria bacterium]|nr:MFS transporter [Acidobacteriota bacterium]
MSAEPATAPVRQGRHLPLAVVFFTVLLDLLGFGMLLPVLPFYALAYHASALQVGLLLSVYSLAQFLFAPLWGSLSDRVGRRKVLLMSIFGTAASNLLLALAPTLTLLFVARFAAGVFAANVSTAQAYIADGTDPERRAKGMGMVGAAFGLGFVLGPGIGSFLVTTGSQTLVPFTAAGLSAFNLVLAFFLLPESLPPEMRHKTSLRWIDLEGLRHLGKGPQVFGILGVIFLVILSFSAMESMLALFCEDRFGFGAKETGFLLVFIGIVITAIQGGLIGKLSRRFGERRLILAGIGLKVVGLVVLTEAGSLPILLAAAAILATGAGIYTPSIPTLISRLTASDRQGATLGLTRAPSSLARAVGPFFGGWFFQHVSPTAPFVASCLVMVAAGLLAVWVLRGLHPE